MEEAKAELFSQVIAVCPHLCPMSLAASLVSIGMTESDDADRLHRACIATLCELGMGMRVDPSVLGVYQHPPW